MIIVDYKFMKKFLKKRWYLFVAVIIIGGFFVSRALSANKTDPNKDIPYTVTRQNLKETLSLSGKIDAEEKANLKFQTSGRLVWVGVKEGDRVNKYQALASLDQREVRAQLDKYLNTYMDTRWDFEQTKDDNKNKIVTDAVKRVLEKSQFDLNNSVLDVEMRNLSVEFSNLWTPIEGIVTKVETPVAGVNITPATSQFEVINPKSIYFSALADQDDVGRVKEQLRGEVVLDAFTESTVSAVVKSVAYTPKSGESGTVYEVKIALNETSLPIRIGMTGDVTFIVRQKQNALSVPLTNVKSENGKKYVMKKTGDTKVKTFLVLGDEYDDMVVVKKGLAEGEIIY